jgi:hypothetical protein
VPVGIAANPDNSALGLPVGVGAEDDGHDQLSSSEQR